MRSMSPKIRWDILCTIDSCSAALVVNKWQFQLFQDISILQTFLFRFFIDVTHFLSLEAVWSSFHLRWLTLRLWCHQRKFLKLEGLQRPWLGETRRTSFCCLIRLSKRSGCDGTAGSKSVSIEELDPSGLVLHDNFFPLETSPLDFHTRFMTVLQFTVHRSQRGEVLKIWISFFLSNFVVPRIYGVYGITLCQSCKLPIYDFLCFCDGC